MASSTAPAPAPTAQPRGGLSGIRLWYALLWVAGALGLRRFQFKLPQRLHDKMKWGKYVVFAVLLGVSFYSMGMAEKLAEVEPFKTAIILKFARPLPYVLFALACVVPSLFIERFYCRYVCPLGGGLAIPARLHMFRWLKRYKDCGNPCQLCAKDCPVEAIHPTGEINPNECIQCLHCQMLYHHPYKCPVVIQKRLKTERRLATASPSMRPGTAGASGPAGTLSKEP